MATDPNDILKSIQETGSWQSGVNDTPTYTIDNQDITAGPQTTPAQGWGDLVKDVGKLGMGAVESQIGGLENYAATYWDDPALKQAWQRSGEDWTKSGEAWTGSISPGGKAVTEAPIFSGTTAAHMPSKLLMGIAKGGLWNAAALIPGAGIGSMVARGLIGAGLGVSGAYNDVVQDIRNTPDDQLQKSSPEYLELRKQFPEYQAKQMLADKAWDDIGAIGKATMAGTSALAGEAGALRTAGRAITGAGGTTLSRLAGGRLAQTGIAAAETGGVQTGQYVGTAIPTREALQSVGAPSDTVGDIATGAIEQATIGAIVGGAGRIIRPVGGENRTGRETSKMTETKQGGAITTVQPGQPDPAQAQALTSNAGTQGEFPFTYRQPNAPPPLPRPAPPPEPPQPRGPYQQPLPLDYWRPPSSTEAPPPRPAVTPPIPPRGTEPAPELPLEQPAQPPQRQGELPLQPPQPPVQQASLDLGAPRQPVTQLSLPGMGAAVTHEPGEVIERPPEAAPKLPEPKPEPVTKVSEPTPTPTPTKEAPPEELKGRIQQVVDDHPTPEGEKVATLKDRKAVQERAASVDKTISAEDKKSILGLSKEDNPIKQYMVHANILANSKAPTEGQVRNFLNAEKQVRNHFGDREGGPEPPTPKPGPKPKPVSPVTKVSEPSEPTQKLPPKAAVAVATAKAKEEPTTAATKKTIKIVGGKAQLVEVPKGEPPKEPPKEPAKEPAPPTKAETRRQAAIAKLVGKKETPVQVTRPTTEPTTEPKVTVLPSGMPAFTRIEPGEKARAIAAKFAPKGEGEPAPKPTPLTKIKELSKLKQAIAAKAKGEEEPPATGKVAAAIKAVLPPKAAAAVAKAKSIEEAKKNVEPNPTPAQRAAKNYRQGHPPVRLTQGQKVTIDTIAGRTNEAHGRILGTADNVPGEHLETIIHPSGHDTFHVINQVDPKTAQFTGHLVVQGAKNATEAMVAYRDHVRRTLGEEAVKGKTMPLAGAVEMSPKEFEDFKKTRNPEEPAYPSTEGQHPFGYVDTPAGKLKTLGSSTIKTALQETLKEAPDHVMHSLYRKLVDQVIKYLPDVPVYYLRQEDLAKVMPDANAVYSSARNHILMGTSSQLPHLTLLHEALHAATVHMYTNNAAFRAKVDRILREYKQGLPSLQNAIMSDNIRYGGGAELLAEIARPNIQGQLARIQMSDKLAHDLNMSSWAKTTRTLWNGLVNAFKDALRTAGFDVPGKDEQSKFTLLDGMLRLTDEAFVARSKYARTDFANMYRAMRDHAEGSHTSRTDEHASQQTVFDTIHSELAHPEHIEGMFADKGKSISDRAEDIWDKVPKRTGTEFYYNHIAKLMTTDTFRMANEKFFGKLDESNPLRKYVEKTLQRATDFQDRTKLSNEFVAQMAKAKADMGHEASEKLSDILSKATAYRFDPRSPIGEGMNSWLKIAADRVAKAQAKGEDLPNLFYKHQQALDKSDEISKDFDELHPLAQKWFGKIIDDYAAKGRERAEIAVDALLHTIDSEGKKLIEEPKLDPNEPSSKDRVDYAKWHNKFEEEWDQNKAGLRQRLLDDDLTDNEKEWLKNRGIDNEDDIHTLSVPKGPYVPLDHAGDWIINARYKIDAPEGAKKINDNTFEFKSSNEMKEFLKKQPPNSRPYTVYYNDEGETVPKWDKWQRQDGSVGFAKNNQRWRVEVNDKYYSGHDSLSAATRRFNQLKETGAFEKIAEPQMKQAGWYSQLEISSPLFKKLIASIDKRTDYTPDQKEAVKQLLRDTAVSSMEGNRIAKTLLPRKLVAGWDTDYIKTYNKYADMHNALMSRNKYAKDMGAIRNEMIKYAKDNEFNPGQTERSAVLSELHDRDNFFGSPDYVGEDTKFKRTLSPMLRTMTSLSFLQNMASVGHLITHATHQIITADLVAAKYGGFGTMGEAARLHTILGGAGFRNVWRSLEEMKNVITKDSKGMNYVESLVDKLTNNHRYGEELKNLIDKAIETGRIHPDQGFDTSIYHASTGKVYSWMSKLDRAARQTMGATEAYNRIWGHALAYIRAREAGETVEQATRSSFDMVSRSQGLLSRANMSPIMSKWYMRAPMQFRGWGINMMMTIANSFYNAFKGETREAKIEAWKRLAYLFGTTAALTGVNGLPSDPMRLSLALAGALGITNTNWSDVQNAIREKLAKMGGSGFANLAMDGILGSMGPFSFFGADRIGFGSLAFFGEPKSYQQADLKAWMFDLAGGAPGETAYRMARGVGELTQGDYAGGISHLVPIKIIDDWAKAWRGAAEGVPTTTGVPGMSPYSVGETIMQGIGLTPAREQRYWEARTAESRAEQASRDEVSQILNAVGKSREGPERLRAMQQVSAYNLQHPEDRITSQDIMKAIRRQTAPSMLGHTVTRRNRERLQQLQEYYGL